MKCPNCGFDNLEYEKYCINCGHPLQKPTSERTTKLKPIIWFGICFLGVLLLFLLYTTGVFWHPDVSQRSINGLTESQTQALQSLSTSSSEEIKYYSRDSIIRYVSMKVQVGSVDVDDPIAVASTFLQQHASIVQIYDISNQLFPTEIYKTNNGHLVHFKQEYKGVPVLGSDLIVEVDNQGNALSIHGGYTPNLDLSTKPTLSAEEAYHLAAIDLGNPILKSSGELVIYDIARLDGSPDSEPRLAWYLEISSDENCAYYILDAENGQILSIVPKVIAVITDSYFYDARGYTTEQLDPGFIEYPTLEGTNEHVTNIKRHLSTIDDFFNSLHDDGLTEFDFPLNIFLNIGDEVCQKNNYGGYSYSTYRNLFMPSLGKEFYLFLCNESADSLDVIAHEFMHNVTHYFNGPDFYSTKKAETGALMESYSDIFAVFIANYQNEQGGEYNDPWLISNDNDGSLIIRKISRKSFSNAYNYNFFIKPKSNLNLTCYGNEAEYGCSHLNSTIHSRAVYYIANEIGFYKTERIFYHTIAGGYLTKDSDFSDARISAYSACYDLMESNRFGISQQDCNVILDAFDRVGISEPTTTTSAFFTVITESPKETPESLDCLDEENKIAFVSNRDGNNEVYVMNSDGSCQTNISNNPSDDNLPNWAIDNNHLIFVSNRDHEGERSGLYVMDIYEGEPIKISDLDCTRNCATSFSISPDGHSVVYSKFVENDLRAEIHFYDLYTNSDDIIYSYEGGATHYHNFDINNIDGKILFERESVCIEIGLINKDGSGFTTSLDVDKDYSENAFRLRMEGKLIGNPPDTAYSPKWISSQSSFYYIDKEFYLVNSETFESYFVITEFDWNTNVQRAVFKFPEGFFVDYYSDNGYPDLFTAPNSELLIIANNNNLFSLNINTQDYSLITNGYEPTFANDGKTMIFVRDGNIFSINIDGTDEVQLTQDNGKNSNPDWELFPDQNKSQEEDIEEFQIGDDMYHGSKILYASSGILSSPKLYSMDADGGNKELLVSDMWRGIAIWSPDRSQILYISNSDGDDEIYVMDANGSNKKQLTNNDCIDGGASWSPDGKHIIFSSDSSGNMNIYIMEVDGSGKTLLAYDYEYDLTIVDW